MWTCHMLKINKLLVSQKVNKLIMYLEQWWIQRGGTADACANPPVQGFKINSACPPPPPLSNPGSATVAKTKYLLQNTSSL